MKRRDQQYIEQPSLFGDPSGGNKSIEPRDTSVTKQDAPRLRGQNLAILSRLEQGAATNRELLSLSMKYTSRISDVRRWLERHGKTIKCERQTGGLSVYRIVEMP